MKGLKIFPLLAIFMGLIPSCRCPEIDAFYMPTTMTTTAIWNDALYEDFENLVIDQAEGFELRIDFTEQRYLTENKSTFSFTNQLLATQQCPSDGDSGLKSKTVSIVITSSSEFQNVAAGESINQFFHYIEYQVDSEPEEVAVENALDDLNTSTPIYVGIPVLLSELPANNLAHIFSVKLTFEDGSSIMGVSTEVQF